MNQIKLVVKSSDENGNEIIKDIYSGNDFQEMFMFIDTFETDVLADINASFELDIFEYHFSFDLFREIAEQMDSM